MFRMLDKDGSGKLDSAEFATFLSTPLIARCASVCMCVCVCVSGVRARGVICVRVDCEGHLWGWGGLLVAGWLCNSWSCQL